MVNRRASSLALAVSLSLIGVVLVAGLAFAQATRYTVDRNISRVAVNRDASADVEYWLTFSASAGSGLIDIVDVGMPNKKYDLDSIVADIDGVPLNDIRPSEVVSPGVEVHLGSRAIRAGRSGTLHLRARVQDMVFQDDRDSQYASIQFSPTWFDPAGARGTTNLEVSIVMPPGVGPDEPRYHEQPFTSATVSDDTVVYTWSRPRADPSTQYMFGASFPKRYVDRVAEKTFDLMEWIGNVGVFVIPIALIGIFALVVGLGVRASNRRKLEYMPPTISVEGVEVRRGLTAPEAAVLMESPLDKVLTLIAFGLVRKRGMRVLERKPLRLEPLSPRPEGLQPYEESFLSSIGGDGRPLEAGLRQAVVDLVNGVTRKMRGFGGRQTVAYYRSIVEKAWQRVMGEGGAELSEDLLGETIEWTAVDEQFEEKAAQTWSGRDFRVPYWWYYYNPVPRGPSQPVPSGSTGRSGPEISLPTLPGSEFASGLVEGMQGFASGVVGNIESFTAGVTQQTNPPPPPQQSSRGGSSSGGGCACACACAGCACACAGGGR